MAVRAKAYVLGQHAGSLTPKTNHALSTNTSGGTPTQVMFETTNNNIDLLPDGGDVTTRYISFSVDVADTNPGTPPEMFMYFLQENADPIRLNTAALPGGVGSSFSLSGGDFGSFPNWAKSGVVGTSFSESFKISAATQVGLRLINTSTASSEGCGAYFTPTACRSNASGSAAPYRGARNGNDGAIDNIRILDVTPVLDKAFAPEIQSIGLTSTMTLTVNNREDLGKKEGWGFVDTLPQGLKFANDGVESTCGATNVSVDVQNGILRVKNGVLAKGQESCTIATTVTSTQPGTYTNGNANGNFTEKEYIDGPENAMVTFYAGSVSWDKVDADDDTLLPGAERMLTGPTPATVSTPANGWPTGEVTDCVAAANEECEGLDIDPVAGKFKVSGLPAGTYTLKETVSPPGYQLAPAPAGYYPLSWAIEFSIYEGETPELHIDLGEIENRAQEGPALPLTGGLGSDLFVLLGGGGVMVGIGAVVALQLRKRRQLG